MAPASGEATRVPCGPLSRVIINHVSPLFFSALTKASYCSVHRFTAVKRIEVRFDVDNTTDKTLQLNFNLELNILILYSEMEWGRLCTGKERLCNWT